MSSKVQLTKYGYYEIKNKPTNKELENILANHYYQGNVENSYEKTYSDKEILSFERHARKKEFIIRCYNKNAKSILDIGCGEGFLLKYFHENDWEVCGIDFSEYGVKVHNPEMLSFLRKGDCLDILESFYKEGKRFDVVNMDMSLEYNLEPEKILNISHKILNEKGILIVRVSNCLSPLHRELLSRGILKEETWFDKSMNLHYFGKDELIRLLADCQYECLATYGDAFMDFDLLNPLTNYYDLEYAGRTCYMAMLDAEEIIENVSLEKMVELEKVLGDMGFGRHITCVCTSRENFI